MESQTLPRQRTGGVPQSWTGMGFSCSRGRAREVPISPGFVAAETGGAPSQPEQPAWHWDSSLQTCHWVLLPALPRITSRIGISRVTQEVAPMFLILGEICSVVYVLHAVILPNLVRRILIYTHLLTVKARHFWTSKLSCHTLKPS